MAVTALDPMTALVVIDLQKGIVGMPTAHPTADIVRHAATLAKAFREHGLPVVLVHVTGGAPGRTEQVRSAKRPEGWADLVPELDRQPSDHTVTKATWGAFTNTDLHPFLQSLRVTQVVIAGISTSIGVESTARYAYELGYNVTLAVDAMTDMSLDAHVNSITRIFPRLGETATTHEIVSLLETSRVIASGELASMKAPLKGTFRSLSIFNYRLWAAGALVSNIGTWMQRIGQDWLVLTQLTHKNATSVGIVMALQFGPQLVLLPLTGYAADRLDLRKLLITTQSCMGALALGLGLLTVTGVVQLWHVYIFALLLGCVTAFDAPARQTFVSELVGEGDLSNAVGLNSTSFNAARMIGPAVAGVLIARVGTGWVFLINAASFVAVIISLNFLRLAELHRRSRAQRTAGSLIEGFRYVMKRPDLKAALLMFFIIGTFGLNFPIFISTMSVGAFHAGASRYGLLTSMMAIGSVSGALLAARRESPRMGLLFLGALVFGIGCALAAIMPNYWLFGITLVLVGISVQTFTTSTNSLVQLSTDPSMRGRVLAILFGLAMGGTPIGAPIVGWVVDHYGPRWALGVGASAGVSAAAVALHYLARHRNLRVHFEAGWPRFAIDMGEL